MESYEENKDVVTGESNQPKQQEGEEKTTKEVCLNCGNELEENQDFCPKCGVHKGNRKCKNCGAEFSATLDFCGKCGSKFVQDSISEELSKKKPKKAPKIIAAIIIVVVCALFGWGMYMSGGSVKQLGKMISEGDFSCFIAHDFKDANCQHGKLCKICGYETGEKTDHQWKEADCENPKRCTVCKLTEGEALGHTTRIGYCDRCGDYVTELSDEFNSICDSYMDALSDIQTAQTYWESGASSYFLSSTYYSYAVLYLGYAADELADAATACGSYSEFATMKTSFTNAKNTLNSCSASFSSIKSSVLSALDDLETATDRIGELEQQ